MRRRQGPGEQQKQTRVSRANTANGEDFTRVQIIALMLHFRAFNDCGAVATSGAQVMAGSNSAILSDE